MSTSQYCPLAIDIRILRVLAAQDTPSNSFIIYGQIPDAKTAAIEKALNNLYAAELIELATPRAATLWMISPCGIKKLAEIDAANGAPGRMRSVSDSVQRVAESHRAATGNDPLHVTVCNSREPELPMRALLCIDEDELDDWWEALDVEQKADAFARFALHMYDDDCHVYVEPTIPVAGTIGDAEPVKATKV
jgi:hypothetical protein